MNTWWTDLRWRIGLLMVAYGVRLCPPSDARDDLTRKVRAWLNDCERQYRMKEYDQGRADHP